jgi:hypothetical protein
MNEVIQTVLGVVVILLAIGFISVLSLIIKRELFSDE